MRTVLISPSWTLLLDTYSHCSTDDRPPVDLAFYFLGLTSGSKNPVHWICVIFRTRVSRGIPKLSDCCWVPLRGECRRYEALDLNDYFGDVTGDNGDQVLQVSFQEAFVLCGFTGWFHAGCTG